VRSGRRNRTTIVDMAISARNQLPGTVQDVQLDTVMARVVVKVGDHLVESVITRASADELHLKKGDAVKVIIKSTEAMIQKD
jgi:molybdopterin-binding protein